MQQDTKLHFDDDAILDSPKDAQMNTPKKIAEKDCATGVFWDLLYQSFGITYADLQRTNSHHLSKVKSIIAERKHVHGLTMKRVEGLQNLGNYRFVENTTWSHGVLETLEKEYSETVLHMFADAKRDNKLKRKPDANEYVAKRVIF